MRTGRLRLKTVITSPSLTSMTRPNRVAASTLKQRSVRSRKARTRLRVIKFPQVSVALDRELFRQFQLGFAQLEAASSEIAFASQREHHEIIFSEQSHQHHRTFERYHQLAQRAEPRVSAGALGAAHERRKLRGRDVEVCFRACLAEHFLDCDSVCSHYERTKAALGAFDNGLKHVLEHLRLRLRTLSAQRAGPGSGSAGRTVGGGSTQQLRLSCWCR